jgi:hypothetical protein
MGAEILVLHIVNLQKRDRERRVDGHQKGLAGEAIVEIDGDSMTSRAPLILHAGACCGFVA